MMAGRLNAAGVKPWVAILLASVSTASLDPRTQPVTDVLTRVCGPDTASVFALALDRSMPQGFELASHSNGTISVRASGLPELAYGAAFYLRRYAHFSFSWERTGGNQVRPPPGAAWPPVPNGKLLVKKTAKWSYYQNVCTQSYSMWWWDWARWEREIDWMALWGINLVLAYTGQEHVFRSVYNQIGVNDSMLASTFDGPAFLTWSRGQGTFGYGGPLPVSWMESQAALQMKIVARLRLLGMEPILPGFQGNVPMALKTVLPQANTSGGWLDAMDPAFASIGTSFAKGVTASFGEPNYVEADGWFSLETGPWLRTDHERRVDRSFGALVKLASEEFVRGPDVEGPVCSFGAGDFIVPSEEEAYVRAQRIFSVITSAVGSSGATWVYQGYPWFRVYSACPQLRDQLRRFVRGFTRAVPKDKLLVLDLVADKPDSALWRYPADKSLGTFVQNASLVWCALSNWGGAVVLGGDLSLALSEARAAIANTPGGEGARTTGVGLTPEGIDASNAYFSIVLDAPWEQLNATQTNAAEWFVEWGHGRCGRSGVVAAEQAYQKLFETVYRPGQPYLWCCSQPKYCPTMLPSEAGSVFRPTWNATELRAALELMVAAAPECNTSAFLFDLVDVAREWLSSTPCLDAFDAVNATALPAELKQQTERLLGVLADVDAVMASEPGGGFLLGRWLKNSRAVADWDGSHGSLADFYELNSRLQVSVWAGAYSRREWSGMVKGYYGGRLQTWLNCTIDHKGCPARNVAGAVSAFEQMWVNETWNPKMLPASPVGDPIVLAKAMLEKYKT